METSELKTKLELLKPMLRKTGASNPNWETDDTSPDDLFRECIVSGYPETEEDSQKYIRCGGVGLGGTLTPKGLYRLLFLLKPEKVDFSDMYKPSLFGFFSADKRVLVDVSLFKYELGLYFYALRELVDSSKATNIIQGHPAADNGYSLTDPTAKLFCEVVTKATVVKWPVYPGNNFEV